MSNTRLPRTIRTKDGSTISTIPEATAYMLAMPPNGSANWNSWQSAAKLAMDGSDLEAITKQIEYALLMDGNLDVGRQK